MLVESWCKYKIIFGCHAVFLHLLFANIQFFIFQGCCIQYEIICQLTMRLLAYNTQFLLIAWKHIAHLSSSTLISNYDSCLERIHWQILKWCSSPTFLVGYRTIAMAKTLTMQFMVRFSHLTVQVPSDVVSQKHELAVWKPYALLWTTAQVTMYL